MTKIVPKKRAKEIVVVLLAVVMFLTFITETTYAENPEDNTERKGIIKEEGISYDSYFDEDTNGGIAEIAVDHSGTTDTKMVKNNYYDDMLRFIESCTDPDLDRQSGAYGTGGYNAKGAWSCSGWVSAVIWKYFNQTGGNGADIAAGITGVNTAAVDPFEGFLKNNPKWEMISQYTAPTSHGTSQRGLDAYNQLKSEIASGKIHAGDVIIFRGTDDKNGVHAGFISNQVLSYYSRFDSTTYGCLNTSSGHDKIRYSAIASWFDAEENHDGASNAYSTGYTIYRANFQLIEYGDVWLKKVDTNGKALNGASFGIWADSSCTGTPLGTSTTVNVSSYGDGVAFFDGSKLGLEDGKTYYVKERVAPTGYRLNRTIYIVTIKAGEATRVGPESGIINTSVEYGSLWLHKVDDTGEGINGAVFGVWDNSTCTGDPIGTSTSEYLSAFGDGTVYFDGSKFKLEAGEVYYVKEITPPTGYNSSNILWRNGVTVVANRATQVPYSMSASDWRNIPWDASVTVKKVDANNNEIALTGAEFTLYSWNKETSQYDTELGVLKDNGDGSYSYGKIKYSSDNQGRFYLKETKYPDGYSGKWEKIFVLTEENNHGEFIFTAENDKTKGEFSKKSITGSSELSGAKLQVIDKNGNIIDEWISTETEHIIEGVLIAGETYTLHEVYAPDGYVIANDITFTVSTDGSVDVVEMVDDTTKIEIEKIVEETGEPLVGAGFQILDGTKVVESWTSTASPHRIEAKLVAGKSYILHEVFAPDGYILSADVIITVSTDGSIDRIRVSDKTTKVVISKKTITGDDELPGATLQIIDESGNIIDEWVSDKEPHYIEGVLAAGKKYTLHETFAPDGFVIANDITFIVSEDGSVDKVEMINDTTKVQISKVSITNNEELPGAALQIIDEKGNIIDEWISGKEPHFIEGVLVAGKTYTLRETYAPEGYVIANEITFKVSEDGSIDFVKMINDTTKVKIRKKSASNGESLVGASLQILDANGKVIEEWISNIEGHFIEGKLVAGEEYILKEKTAPTGYELAEDIKFVVAMDGSIDDIEMLDIKKTEPSAPKTGDNLNILALVLVAAATAMLIAFLYRKIRNDKM